MIIDGPTARVEVLAYAIDRVSLDEAVERCLTFVDEGRPRMVVPLNAAILAMAERDPRLRAAIRRGDLVLADGLPVVWAARLAGADLRHRVAGIDLMERLVEQAGLSRLRIFLLGGRPEIVRKVADRIGSEHPGAVIAGYRDGYFSESESDDVIEEVRKSQADILFVALPSPMKEVWCSDNLDEFGASVVLPVGGAFDVYSGEIRRAPRWMQQSGLEWSWRLLMDPRQKWRRYLFLNSAFVWLSLRAALRKPR